MGDLPTFFPTYRKRVNNLLALTKKVYIDKAYFLGCIRVGNGDYRAFPTLHDTRISFFWMFQISRLTEWRIEP